jgi:hypothetical protein
LLYRLHRDAGWPGITGTKAQRDTPSCPVPTLPGDLAATTEPANRRWRPRRRASHVGAVDEGFGRAAYLLVALLDEQVDRALAGKQAILRVQPLADAPGGQRV